MSDLTKALGKLWGAVIKADAPPSPTSAAAQTPTPEPTQPSPAPRVEPEFQGDYKKLGYKWKDFDRALKYAEDALRDTGYEPYVELSVQATDVAFFMRRQQRSGNTLAEDLFLLPQETKTKPLDELLTTKQLPQPPSIPSPPPVKLRADKYPSWYSQYIPKETAEREKLLKRAAGLKSRITETWRGFEEKRAAAREKAGAMFDSALRGDTEQQVACLEFVNQRYPLAELLRKDYKVAVSADSSTAVVQFEFPDFTSNDIVIGYSGKYSDKEKLASPTQKRKLIKQCLYSTIVRSAYITATLASRFGLQSIVVNVQQNWFDAATGQAKNGVIASLQAPVDYLVALDLAKLDPEACFKHLKGIATPSLENASPIRPIFVLDKQDERFVASKSVEQVLEPEANLAAIPWEDFEHLVAQLFEWEFAKNGVEVKVTRASRDRGVDAVLFDPDPLRGGKYVLQAKRYTTTVDVSAVRDLFGTVMNEGANRGILISTSSYGPDAYEFAKDKPISLVDGPNLLLMLQKHGKQFRINLEEARRMNANGDGR